MILQNILSKMQKMVNAYVLIHTSKILKEDVLCVLMFYWIVRFVIPKISVYFAKIKTTSTFNQNKINVYALKIGFLLINNVNSVHSKLMVVRCVLQIKSAQLVTTINILIKLLQMVNANVWINTG